MDKLPLNQWAEDDRPREKFELKGRHSLSDAELLSILLGTGTSDETAVELARTILRNFNHDLERLGKCNPIELTETKGVGKAKAITVLAAFELGRRRQEIPASKLDKICSSEQAALHFQPLLGELMHEEFWVALLNRANMLIGKQQISKGGMSGTVADPKIIFQVALQQKASGIILCHNHPSGNLKPSDADIRLTKNLAEAGRVLEINVLDHLIVGRNGYYSFADEGKL
jgi:DNA repair protein RadC